MRPITGSSPCMTMILRAGVVLVSLSAVAVATAGEPAPASKLRVAVLPSNVTVLETGLVSSKYSEQWTVAAREAMDAALVEAVERSPVLERAEIPALAPEEQSLVDEFATVASVTALQIHANRAWGTIGPKPRRMDRTLGPSLAFLADRAGITHVLGTSGVQWEQSPGAVAFGVAGMAATVLFPPFVGLPPYTSSNASMYLVDVRSGDITWFSGQTGHELSGINFTDLRARESADKVVAKLLEAYPESPWLKSDPPQVSGGVATSRTSPVGGGFAIHLPKGWYEKKVTSDSVTAIRDGSMLNEMTVELRRHSEAFPRTSRGSRRDATPAELAELFVEELKASGLPELQVLETTSVATLAGQPAFRVRSTYRPQDEWRGALLEQETLGTATPDGLLLAQFTAPRLHYFEASLPMFHESIASMATTTLDDSRGSRRSSP